MLAISAATLAGLLLLVGPQRLRAEDRALDSSPKEHSILVRHTTQETARQSTQTGRQSTQTGLSVEMGQLAETGRSAAETGRSTAPWSSKRPTIQITADSLRFGKAAPRSYRIRTQSPDVFIPPASMRPIPNASPISAGPLPAGAPASTTSSTTSPADSFGATRAGQVLRLSWRSPTVAGSDSGVRQVDYPSLEPARNSRTTQAAARGEPNVPSASPFNDPFEDTRVPAPREVRQFDLEPLAPSDPNLSNESESLDDEIPRPPAKERYAPRLGPNRPYDTSVRCNPVFNNDRDCCQEMEICRTARDLVRSATIDRISVDITPRFSPDEDDPIQEQRRLSEQLGRSPARTWRDKEGRDLVEGRMLNFARGRVLVVDEEGETRELHFNDLHEEDLCFVTAWWSLPSECGLGLSNPTVRNWTPITMTWKASAVCNKPLYFEEVQLERYGHTMGPLIQPAVSSAHFFMNIAFLPYKAGIHPPHECRYALGYYRPGNCAPWLLPPIPLSLRGAVAQAAAVGGLIAILQ